VVGAYKADINGQTEAGAAYVFSRNWGGADNWGEVKKLTASDYTAYDFFGTSVAINGDKLVVGAYWADIDGQDGTGAAYIFYRNWNGMDNWGQVKKLTASDYSKDSWFGISVTISGDTLVVGAALANISGQEWAGAVYVFSRNWGGTESWGQVRKLVASDYAEYYSFGWSASISNDMLVVGAPGADNIGQEGSGAAYIFFRNCGGGENWGQVKKLAGSQWGDNYGESVSISGDTLVVGAHSWYQYLGEQDIHGMAYIFSRNWGGVDNWGHVKELVASNYGDIFEFGSSVAIDGSTALVGSDGAAYVFQEVSTALFLPLVVR